MGGGVGAQSGAVTRPAARHLPAGRRHAALVCAGASPVYYTPGFGPWPLGWGWFLLGALTGVLLLSAILLGSYQAGAWGLSPPANRPRDADAAAAEVLRAFTAVAEVLRAFTAAKRKCGFSQSRRGRRRWRCCVAFWLQHWAVHVRRATGPATTPAAGGRCVTRVHRDTATHWRLPLAKTGVASPEAHARMCLPACLTMLFVLVESLHVGCRLQHFGPHIVFLQSWLATAALAECARRPRTARHARHAVPSMLYNAWCLVGNCRLGPTSWLRSFCEQRSSSWSCSPGALLTKAAMLWRMPARSRRRRPHAETAAAAAVAALDCPRRLCLLHPTRLVNGFAIVQGLSITSMVDGIEGHSWKQLLHFLQCAGLPLYGRRSAANFFKLPVLHAAFGKKCACNIAC